MSSPPRSSSALVAKVDTILLRHWDPIRIKDIPSCADEYSSYAPTVAGMVLSGASIEEIAAHLLAIERDRMGLPPSPELALATARRLVESRSDF